MIAYIAYFIFLAIVAILLGIKYIFKQYKTVIKNKNLYNFVCPNCGSKMVSPTAEIFSKNIRIEEV